MTGAHRTEPAAPIAAPKTDDELHAWVVQHLGMSIPRTSCCDEHTPPFQAFADAYFARVPVSVWLASRGFGGKSMMMAGLGATEGATLAAEVNVLGGSKDQSENVVRYLGDGVRKDTFPAGLVAETGTRGVTTARVQLSNGGTVRALPASTKAVRGPHPSRLRIDEADELSLLILDAALGQPMDRPGSKAQIVISSTHHYPNGTFSEVLRRAQAKGWPVYRWCYRCNMGPGGWLSEAEVERKRGVVTGAMWQTEYELQEPSVEGRAIDSDAVRAAFGPALGTWDGDNGERIVVEEPRPDADYGTGTDWAKERDWTVITTFRVLSREPFRVRCVAWERRGRQPWPVMFAAHSARTSAYGGAAFHDIGGVGSVADDMIEVPEDVESSGLILQGRQRLRIFGEYIVAIERGEVEFPAIEWARSEHLYATLGDLYRSGTGFHPPDSFVSGALAYHAAKHGGTPWEVYEDD